MTASYELCARPWENEPIPQPNRELLDTLLQAYAPCPNFGTCREATWDPGHGHIPRGFLGATGELADVEVVMHTIYRDPTLEYGG